MKANLFAYFGALIFLIHPGLGCWSGSEPISSQAQVILTPALNTGKDSVTGTIYLKQVRNKVYITGTILGLEPGYHGFHVHEIGGLGDNCKNAGGHFNPKLVNLSFNFPFRVRLIFCIFGVNIEFIR
jgi:Cu/Zn superoxide dismutase